MGLDMYLLEKRCLKTEDKHAIESQFGLKNFRYVACEFAYWRKAYAIHDWFINNADTEVENCRDSYIPIGTLNELRASCGQILQASDKERGKYARDLIPDPDGEYDDDYYADIKYTYDVLGKLNEDCDYCYHPWW